jgi:hypothetical protein
VISRAFSFFLLHNHVINKKKSFSGDVNYEANFPFFFCFISNGPYTPPLPSPSTHVVNTKPAQKLNHLSSTLIRTVFHRGREGSDFEVLHSRILVLLLPNTEVLVRFELLYLSGGASGGKLSQALIHPLKNPPQSTVIHLLMMMSFICSCRNKK